MAPSVYAAKYGLTIDGSVACVKIPNAAGTA